jgi:hypothetical protein
MSSDRNAATCGELPGSSHMNIKHLFLAALCAAACSKSGSTKMKTVDLGDTGYVIDVPDDWSVESPMKGFFELKGGRPHPQIMTTPEPPSTIDELAKSTCEGQKDIVKETLPGGGVAVTCTGPSEIGEGRTTTKLAVEIPKGQHSSFDCIVESDKNIDLPTKVCKSIRKKA